MAKIVTITNPLTGQPAQVDQLDHTAQQIDDGLNIARGVSNPNLLDNWYFGNPVDQRQGRIVKPNTTYYSDNTLTTSAGTTSAYVTAYRYATGTANGVNYASFKLENKDTAPTYYAAPENVVRGYTGARYGIDRWKIQSGTIVLNDNYISLISPSSSEYAQLRQWHDANDLVGKKATFSILSDNGLRSTTLTIGTDKYVTFDDCAFYHTISSGIVLYEIRCIAGMTANLIAVKLELGSQQTLAHQDDNGNWQLNEIPDYGEQLARCQRYFVRFNFGRNDLFFGSLASTLDKAWITIPTPVVMRKAPVVSFSKTFSFTIRGNGFQLVMSTDNSTVTPDTSTSRCCNILITPNTKPSEWTAHQVVMIFTSTPWYMDCSSDL